MNALQKVEAGLPATTPMELLSQAIEKGAGLEVIAQFMDLQERWEKNLARKAFDRAIAAAKAEMPIIAKNKTGHNSKRYADFAAMAREVDPVISKHGLSYRFRTTQDEKLIHVSCILSHEAGHSEENTLVGPADATGSKNAIQAIGSTLTYLQRYSLTQALGLAASEDDDGKSAGNGDVITLDQAADLRTDLEAIAEHEKKEVSGTIANFLKFMKVENFADIPAARLEEVKAILKQRLKA